jgi:hypothetical protein
MIATIELAVRTVIDVILVVLTIEKPWLAAVDIRD